MEPEVRLQWTRRLAVIVVAWTFALMGVGAWVKATGSGLACPDWPQCYGQWLPPFPSIENQGVDEAGQPVHYTQAQVLYEWAHRAIASALGVPFILLVLAAAHRSFSTPLRALPILGAIVLAIQVGLGGGTVMQGNPDWLTTMHLLMATVFFFLVTCTMMLAFLRPWAEGEGAGLASGARTEGARTVTSPTTAALHARTSGATQRATPAPPRSTTPPADPVGPPPGPFPGEVWPGER